jgi:hypothetical protein
VEEEEDDYEFISESEKPFNPVKHFKIKKKKQKNDRSKE